MCSRYSAVYSAIYVCCAGHTYKTQFILANKSSLPICSQRHCRCCGAHAFCKSNDVIQKKKRREKMPLTHGGATMAYIYEHISFVVYICGAAGTLSIIKHTIRCSTYITCCTPYRRTYETTNIPYCIPINISIYILQARCDVM